MVIEIEDDELEEQRTFGDDRRCAVCGNRLSIYNPGKTCHYHNRPTAEGGLPTYILTNTVLSRLMNAIEDGWPCKDEEPDFVIELQRLIEKEREND